MARVYGRTHSNVSNDDLSEESVPMVEEELLLTDGQQDSQEGNVCLESGENSLCIHTVRTCMSFHINRNLELRLAVTIVSRALHARSLGTRVNFRIGFGGRIKQNSNLFLAAATVGLEVVSSPIELEVPCSILTVVSFFSSSLKFLLD